MKTLIASIVLAIAACAGAGATRVPKEINGEKVLPGATFDAYAFCKIAGLTFYTSTVEKGRVPCTIITGQFTSNLPTAETSVEVTIAVYNVSKHAGRIWHVGDFTTTFDRPKPAATVAFAILGPVSCRTTEKMNPIFDNGPLHNAYLVSVKLVKPPGLPQAKAQKPEAD